MLTTSCYYLIYAMATVCHSYGPVPPIPPIPPAQTWQSLPRPAVQSWQQPSANTFLAQPPTLQQVVPGLGSDDE